MGSRRNSRLRSREGLDCPQCLSRPIQCHRQNSRRGVRILYVVRSLHRLMEFDRLFPCLRKYNIRFAAYSPLAYVLVQLSPRSCANGILYALYSGGILTTAYLSDPEKIRMNPRFQHPRYKDRYTTAVQKLAGIRTLSVCQYCVSNISETE